MALPSLPFMGRVAREARRVGLEPLPEYPGIDTGRSFGPHPHRSAMRPPHEGEVEAPEAYCLR